MIRVSRHAIDRWIERVCPCSREEARNEIMSHLPVLEIAADFGCGQIKLANHARLILENRTVVTVTPPETFQFPKPINNNT